MPAERQEGSEKQKARRCWNTDELPSDRLKGLSPERFYHREGRIAMKMKMKIQALYLTGTVLLIGAAGVGDSITFDARGQLDGRGHPDRADGRRRHCLLGLWPGARDRAGRKAQLRRYCGS